jgi:signal transduction histidine kinase
LQRNTDYLKNIVTKTIELAQLNSSNITLKFERINLVEVINKVLLTKSHVINEKGIKIINNLEGETYIVADKLAMEELFFNILENAIKYNNEGGSISISATSDDNEVLVLIKDTGIGLSPDQIEKIFEEFYKADESRHHFESSGLGMAIARRITELHHGKIWIESPGLGKGATVNILLPMVI